MTIDVWNAESLVNTYTPGNQRAPVVAGLADGGYAVAWMNNTRHSPDPNQTNAVLQVSYRVFNADGSPRTGELVLYDPEWILRAQSDTVWQKSLWAPSIAAAADGSFTIVMTSEGSSTSPLNDHSGNGHEAFTFSPAGAMIARAGVHALSDEPISNSATSHATESAIAILNNHRIVANVATTSFSSVTSSDIELHTYDTQMNANYAYQNPTVATTVRVTGTLAHALRQPDVTTINASTGFVVTWIDDTDHTLHAKTYGLDNAIGSTPYAVSGDIAIGAIVATDLPINPQQSGPDGTHFQAVAGLTGGGFAVAWTASGANGDGDATAVKLKVFDAAGAAITSELLVNANTLGYQERPDILALRDGRFLVSFTDTSQSPFLIPTVHFQLFDAAGVKSGAEFSNHIVVPAGYDRPNLSELADGRVAVVWSGYGQSGAGDGGFRGIYQEILDLTSGVQFRANSNNTLGVSTNDLWVTGILSPSTGQTGVFFSQIVSMDSFNVVIHQLDGSYVKYSGSGFTYNTQFDPVFNQLMTYFTGGTYTTITLLDPADLNHLLGNLQGFAPQPLSQITNPGTPAAVLAHPDDIKGGGGADVLACPGW
jgi:large repetitive protein